jgi:hypothetical protein
MVDKVCINCGVAFEAPTKRAVFCTTYCRIAFNRLMKALGVTADLELMQKHSEFEFPDDLEAIQVVSAKVVKKGEKREAEIIARLGKVPVEADRAVRKINEAIIGKPPSKRTINRKWLKDNVVPDQKDQPTSVGEGSFIATKMMEAVDDTGATNLDAMEVWKDGVRPETIDLNPATEHKIELTLPYADCLRLAKDGKLSEGVLAASQKKYKFNGNQISMIRSKMK